MAIRQEDKAPKPELQQGMALGKRWFKIVYVKDFEADTIYQFIKDYGMDQPVFIDDCAVCGQEFSIRARLAYSHLKRYPKFFPPDRCKGCFHKARGISTPTPPGNARLHIQQPAQTLPIAARADAAELAEEHEDPEEPAQLTYNNARESRPQFWRRLLARPQKTSRKELTGKDLEGKLVKLTFKQEVSFSNHDESDAPYVGYCVTYGFSTIVMAETAEAAEAAYKYGEGITLYKHSDIAVIELLPDRNR